MSEFRHEWKHVISASDSITIRQRMSVVARTDPHAVDGRYRIRSLYFDNLYDKALRDKIDGVNRREKFRLRFYNDDTDLIHLEKKSKINGLCAKESTRILKGQVEDLLNGELGWMPLTGDPLITQLYAKMLYQGLQPRTIVDYTRQPFIYGPGNVRVTIDDHIRTGILCTDFLDMDCVTVPAPDAGIILEVKWDEFLPDPIRAAVGLDNRRVTAFSKYAACRVYG